MKRTFSILFTLIFSLSMYAFHYRPELDGEGGLFFVTGDNAASGIAMLTGCIAIAFACYKIVNLIDKNEEVEGVRKVIVNILYAICAIAIIAGIGLAFALWWIVLIGVILYAIGAAFYEKMEERRSSTKGNNGHIEEHNKLVSLPSFENSHGALEVGCVVNDNNGDYFDICRCTNYKGFSLYIAFSPYLGKISYATIMRMKDRLYIRCDGNACNFLCTKESESRRKTDIDKEGMTCHYLKYNGMLSVLKQLNVEGKAGDYTFTDEKDF